MGKETVRWVMVGKKSKNSKMVEFLFKYIFLQNKQVGLMGKKVRQVRSQNETQCSSEIKVSR